MDYGAAYMSLDRRRLEAYDYAFRNGRNCLWLMSGYFYILYRSQMVLRCRHVLNGWERAARRAACS